MKILLNIGTHGDESIGIAVANEIEKQFIKKGEVKINIANPLALKLNKRCIDSDLNRIFPGKKNGDYEEKLAYNILPIIKSADVVIDIHSTQSGLRDALIVTKINKLTKSCIKAINPKYLLLMNISKTNALISNAKVGLAFEYGKDKEKRTIKETVLGIKKLLAHLNMIDFESKQNQNKTIAFKIDKQINKPGDAILFPKIKNYSLIKKGTVYASIGDKKMRSKEDFYPILFGQKNYKDIFGFAGKKIDFKDL